MFKFIKRNPILQITLILISGFFVSYFVFDLLGGNDNMQEYFNWQSVIALLVVLVSFVAAFTSVQRSNKRGL